ncbi:MAG: hypothetical protein QI197_06365 [Candidatus Korarchaeota archaeon]|nr:hypothetical protein [Candidatus Korarchaeota archaeon]
MTGALMLPFKIPRSGSSIPRADEIPTKAFHAIVEKLGLRFLSFDLELPGYRAYTLIAESPFISGLQEGSIYGIFILVNPEPPSREIPAALAILSELIPDAMPLSSLRGERVEIHALHLRRGNLKSEGFSVTLPSLDPDHLIPAATAFLSYHLVSDLRRGLEEEFRSLPTLTKSISGGRESWVGRLERLNSYTASYPVLISLLRRLYTFIDPSYQEVYEVVSEGLKVGELIEDLESLLSSFSQAVHGTLTIALLNKTVEMEEESEKTSKRLSTVQDILAALSSLAVVQLFVEVGLLSKEGPLGFLGPYLYYATIAGLVILTFLAFFLPLRYVRRSIKTFYSDEGSRPDGGALGESYRETEAPPQEPGGEGEGPLGG